MWTRTYGTKEEGKEVREYSSLLDIKASRFDERHRECIDLLCLVWVSVFLLTLARDY